MNVFEFHTAYAADLAAIASTMVQNRADQKVASEAGKDRNESLAEKVRQFASKTHADGVAIGEARELFQASLKLLNAPEGSVKASGNHYAGYRILLAEGKDISNASTAVAQEAAASPETRAIKEAKRTFNAATKKWGVKEWQGLLLALNIKAESEEAATEDNADADNAEVVREAQAAA